MHMATALTINGETKSFDAPPDMPLLWVLRDILGMTGTKFGCGIAQCGACTVHVDGKAVRSCVLPVSAVANRAITTIEACRQHAGGREGAEGLARCSKWSSAAIASPARSWRPPRCWRQPQS